MKKLNLTIITFVTFLILLSCTDDKGYTVEIVDGVEFIRNSSDPNDIEYTLNKSLFFELNPEKIDPTDSTKLVSEVSAVDFDRDGNIYILDGIKCKIHKYDNKGEYVKSFCRKGQGPGEVQNTSHLFITADRIHVPDFQVPKIAVFDLDGNFIKNIICEKHESTPSYGKPVNGGIVDSSTKLSMEGEGSEMVMSRLQTICYYNLEMRVVKELFSRGMTFKQTEDINPYSASIAMAAYNDEIIIAQEKAEKYKIEKYNLTGKKLKVITKPFIPTQLSEKQKDRLLKIGQKYSMRYVAEYTPAIKSLKYDKYGNIWVNVYDNKSNEETTFDVFSNDGVYLNSIPLFDDKEDLDIEFIKDKLVVTDDKTGGVRIYNY